jgi:hypothetical protein
MPGAATEIARRSGGVFHDFPGSPRIAARTVLNMGVVLGATVYPIQGVVTLTK